MKSEGIEALLYPSVEHFSAKPSEHGNHAAVDWTAAEFRLRRIVEEVNQKLLPYQRIAKVTVLRKPMEETTTKKVKRHSHGTP